jgi:hypothetical protein
MVLWFDCRHPQIPWLPKMLAAADGVKDIVISYLTEWVVSLGVAFSE